MSSNRAPRWLPALTLGLALAGLTLTLVLASTACRPTDRPPDRLTPARVTLDAPAPPVGGRAGSALDDYLSRWADR